MSVDYRPDYDPADVDSDYGHTGGDITVPTFTGDTRPFRFWCQKALPLVYDDSLSYYEVLCKMAEYMNNFMTDLTTVEDSMTEFGQQFVINQQFLNSMADQLGQNVADLEAYINDRMEDFMNAYTQLQNYVNTYFDNLDVQEEINTKLDEMASDGTLNDLFDPVLETWMQQKTAQIDAAIANQDAIQAAQNARISVLEGRMDTFDSLPSGSTSGNAELLGIRTNFLGETYPSAGDAVRASDMIASGFLSIGFSRLTEWDGNESSQMMDTVQIDVSAYKGGHVIVIGNMYQFVSDIELGAGIELFASNVSGKTVDPNARQYPFPDGFSGVASAVFKNFTVLTTSVQGEERIMLQLAIPEDFTYQYLKLGNVAPIPGEGYSYTEPAAIVYANSWNKTTVDPTLTIAGDAADAKAAGDAIDELNERLDYETALVGEPDDYHTTNLINENALTQSKMLADDGSITDAPNNTWYVTDFLDVGHEEHLYLTVKNTTMNLLYCYDENKNPIGSRITSSSDRLTSHTTYYYVHLYKGAKYVRANMRTTFMGSYMLTKYFYPSAYVASGTYANRTPSTVASKSELSYSTYRTESGIVRNYYASWKAQLSDGTFSLLDMPQNSIAYVNLNQIVASQIVGLPYSSGAVYVEKIGRGDYSMYRIYRNGIPWSAIGFYIGSAFVWLPSTNYQELKIGMLGDSVTEGRVGGTSSITDYGIPYWVGYETGLEVVNLGVGNMGWASHQYLETNAYEYLQTIPLSGYSLLTLQYGLNDGDIPLGTYEDTTTATIMGSVYKCLEYIYSQNASVQVVIINSTVGSKPESFPYYNPNAHHSASDGWTFTEYFEEMKKFCDKYSIPLIDGYKGLNAWNRNTLIGDNVHPTVDGYKVLGRYIAGQIKSMI